MEISCGTILHTVMDGVVHYVLLQADDGYCGFPKGHMEKGETEIETALRETWEETSVRARIFDGFRETDEYIMPNGIRKRVIYFVADYFNQTLKHNPGFEVRNILLLPFEQAYSALTFEGSKAILRLADRFIKQIEGERS